MKTKLTISILLVCAFMLFVFRNVSVASKGQGLIESTSEYIASANFGITEGLVCLAVATVAYFVRMNLKK